MPSNDPKFDLYEIRVSEVFRRFADYCDDPDKMKAVDGSPKSSKDFLDLLTLVRRFAFCHFDDKLQGRKVDG